MVAANPVRPPGSAKSHVMGVGELPSIGLKRYGAVILDVPKGLFHSHLGNSNILFGHTHTLLIHKHTITAPPTTPSPRSYKRGLKESWPFLPPFLSYTCFLLLTLLLYTTTTSLQPFSFTFSYLFRLRFFTSKKIL